MRKDEASEAHWKKYGPGATGVGWDLGFLALDRHLKSGEPIVESESNTWLGPPTGKAFLEKTARLGERPTSVPVKTKPLPRRRLQKPLHFTVAVSIRH